jgi:hypothetical protein
VYFSAILFACFEGFAKIFHGYKEHAKTFAFFFAQMLVVYFVRFAQGTEIEIVGAAKELEALMDQDVVHHKIGQAIEGNAHAYINQESPRLVEGAGGKKGHSKACKNDEEGIVALKEIFLVFVVVIVV